MAELLALKEQLPGLLATLRAAAAGFVPSCVAPSRSNERQARLNWIQAVQLRKNALRESHERDAKLVREAPAAVTKELHGELRR